MFTFKLELEAGEPADPPTFTAAVPNWKAWALAPHQRFARASWSWNQRARSHSSTFPAASNGHH